jgi:hypothetical protein
MKHRKRFERRLSRQLKETSAATIPPAALKTLAILRQFAEEELARQGHKEITR